MNNTVLTWTDGSILWASRGRLWGFQLLATPQEECDWDHVRRRIFTHSDAIPAFFYGRLADGPIPRPFVAARFYDPDKTHVDESSREIYHEVAVFLQSGQDLGYELLTGLWPIQVFEHFSFHYASIFSAPTYQGKGFSAPGGRIEDVEFHETNCVRWVSVGDVSAYPGPTFPASPNRAAFGLPPSLKKSLPTVCWLAESIVGFVRCTASKVKNPR